MHDDRTARWLATGQARRRARRDAWRRSGGDRRRYREIMREHIAARTASSRYLYYYEDEPPRRSPSVGRELLAEARMWTGWCLAAALVIVVSDRL